MDDLSLLLRRIIETPEDDTLRLAYADLLQERSVGGSVKEKHARFIRLQVERSQILPPCLKPQYEDIRSDAYGGMVVEQVYRGVCGKCPNCRRFEELQDEEIRIGLLAIAEGIAGEGVGFANGGQSLRRAYTPLAITVLNFERGFVDSIRTTAEVWAANADKWFWHPSQRLKCERCGGDGMAHGADRPFEWSPDADYAKCVICKGIGKGEVRPCPDTAQPLREVELTTWPSLDYPERERLGLMGLQDKIWPGLKFTMPPVPSTVAISTGLAIGTEEVTEEYDDPFPDVPWGGGI